MIPAGERLPKTEINCRLMIQSPIARALLFAPAKLYQLAVKARIVAYRSGLIKINKLDAPVISVGNLTVGGTGKTPCVAFIAQRLRDAGHQVAILSRGYKRQTKGRVEVSNGNEILSTPAESGDEPFLLASKCPGVRVVVDADRVAAGRWLESRAQVSSFILDDAYQHLKLFRDLNLLLVDATENLSKSEMIPFGRLREPLVEIRRADMIIVTRSNLPFNRNKLIENIKRYSRPDIPIFFARHRMTCLRRLGSDETVEPIAFARRNVAAVSGIAKPERFIDDLQKFGMKIAYRRDFPDHHRYSPEDFISLVKGSVNANAEALIITEKDAANLPLALIEQSSLPVYAACIEFHCEQETAFVKILLESVSPTHNS